MAELKSPFDGGVIEVGDDLVDRYVDAGWEKTKKTTRKTASSKSENDK